MSAVKTRLWKQNLLLIKEATATTKQEKLDDKIYINDN